MFSMTVRFQYFKAAKDYVLFCFSITVTDGFGDNNFSLYGIIWPNLAHVGTYRLKFISV